MPVSLFDHLPRSPRHIFQFSDYPTLEMLTPEFTSASIHDQDQPKEQLEIALQCLHTLLCFTIYITTGTSAAHVTTRSKELVRTIDYINSHPLFGSLQSAHGSRDKFQYNFEGLQRRVGDSVGDDEEFRREHRVIARELKGAWVA